MIRYYVKGLKLFNTNPFTAAYDALKYMTGNRLSSDTDILEKTLGYTGFAYDPEQDIYYSVMDAWQRNFGFCRLYDEAAAPLRMIVDTEQIKFDYDNKKWSIQFWKGQYGITTGGEIGVFNIGLNEYNNLPDKSGTLFKSANSEDILRMSFDLVKNGNILFSRADTHWWLTGFVLGEFSEPRELYMDIRITLKDSLMRDAFIEGLRRTGYKDDEIKIINNTVIFTFDRPHTKQPSTRNFLLDRSTQRKNKNNCKLYNRFAKKYVNSYEKTKTLPTFSPRITIQGTSADVTRQLYRIFNTITKFF